LRGCAGRFARICDANVTQASVVWSVRSGTEVPVAPTTRVLVAGRIEAALGDALGVPPSWLRHGWE
jgi:hypothetical protein